MRSLLARWWPLVAIAAIVLVVIVAPLEWLVVLAVALLVVTLAGCAAFIAVYRPLIPWSHDVYGRNLLLLCWWLGLWFTVALAQLFVPMPPKLAIGAQLVALAGVCTIIWDRVFLVPRAHREEREEREEQARRDREGR